MLNKVTFIIAFATIYLHHFCASQLIGKNVDTQEVEAGKIATLHCKSNDDYHNFMFWHLSKTDIVIGPRNEFNSKKFKYEILSGNLTIKGVSPNEAGLYICVSDGLDKRNISIHSVNVVLKNWEYGNKQEFYGTPRSTSGNLWKVSVVLGSILVFLVILLVALHVYHRETEKPNYFDIIEQNDDDEDSTEELFTREPSTSSGLKNNTTNKNGISDNFQKVYTVINMKKS